MATHKPLPSLAPDVLVSVLANLRLLFSCTLVAIASPAAAVTIIYFFNILLYRYYLVPY